MALDLPNSILIQSIEHSNLAHTISLIQDDLPLSYVNQAFFDQTGYSREEVIGRNCRFLQGEGTDPNTVELIRTALKAFQPLDIEILNYKKDGTPFWNRLRMSPVYDEEGQPIAFVGIQSDITAIRERARVDQERQKLEALGRMTGNISHEIKNALQPVRLMSDMLKDYNALDDEKIARCIEILGENVALADHVIQDVLKFSRKSEDKVERIPVSVLQEDVTRFVKNLLHSRIDFQADVQKGPAQDRHVNLNVHALYQVLMNLVSNAVYAMEDSGRLTLRCYSEDLDSARALSLGVHGGTYLCIAVEDTGCGMDEKNPAFCYRPFLLDKTSWRGHGIGAINFL